MGVGQEIVDAWGQEGTDQVYPPDTVNPILPGRIQTLPVTTAY